MEEREAVLTKSGGRPCWRPGRRRSRRPRPPAHDGPTRQSKTPPTWPTALVSQRRRCSCHPRRRDGAASRLPSWRAEGRTCPHASRLAPPLLFVGYSFLHLAAKCQTEASLAQKSVNQVVDCLIPIQSRRKANEQNKVMHENSRNIRPLYSW